MRTSALLSSAFIVCSLLVSFDVSARGRQTAGNASATSTPQSRPAATTSRPATTQSPPAATARPATPQSRPATATTRPGSPSNSGNMGASQRPGTPNVRPSQPAPPPPAPPRPNGYHPNYSYRPPMPHTPPNYMYYRPTPPPSWRPVGPVPNFNSILGIALGTFFSNSINALFNSGYNVTGYTNNQVYLSNVNYCNVTWPNVTMYYRNGYLQGSLFSASSISYDPSRYNYVYSYLTSRYGLPVSSQNLSGGGMSCTWWGNGNSYLTLSFYPEYINGATRFFTTLSTGN